MRKVYAKEFIAAISSLQKGEELISEHEEPGIVPYHFIKKGKELFCDGFPVRIQYVNKVTLCDNGYINGVGCLNYVGEFDNIKWGFCSPPISDDGEITEKNKWETQYNSSATYELYEDEFLLVHHMESGAGEWVLYCGGHGK